MCGRYSLSVEESQQLRDLLSRLAVPELKTGEIFPTNLAPIINREMAPDAARWGLPKYSGSGVIINARAETAPEKRLFRQNLLARRCAVPTTGFYEWDAQKRKHLFRMAGEPLLYLAGFYTDGPERRFVILTTQANASVQQVHSRMPLILSPQQLPLWAQDTDFALEHLSASMPPLESRPVL